MAIIEQEIKPKEEVIEKPKTRVRKKKVATTPKRRIKGAQEVHHDLFKLEVASFQKNIGTVVQPRLIPAEHVHFYHSVNSKGIPQKECSMIGGHTHEILTKLDEKGNLIAECGPPIQKFRNSKSEYVAKDSHVHNVAYLESEMLTLKKMTKEAAQSISQFHNEYGKANLK